MSSAVDAAPESEWGGVGSRCRCTQRMRARLATVVTGLRGGFDSLGLDQKRSATGPVRVASATGDLPDLEAAASGLGVRRSGVAERGRQDTVQDSAARPGVDHLDAAFSEVS